MQLQSKLPKVGTTIFSVMSQLAIEHKAVNLGQGFPDFDGPQALRDALAAAMNSAQEPVRADDRHAQLREQIALKSERSTAAASTPSTEVTVTSGATEALFAAIARLRAQRRRSHRARSVLRQLRAGDRARRRPRGPRAAAPAATSRSTGSA